MSADQAAPPIRRSPLAGVAARLGATWIDPTVHWALEYGDVAAEIDAATSGCAVADWGPTDKLSVKGPTARRVLVDLGIGAPLGEAADGAVAGVVVRSWAIAPDETLVIVRADHASGSADAVRAAVEASGPTVTGMSSGLAGLRVIGPAARDLLAEVCALDLAADRFADGRVASAPVANVRVALARRDISTTPAFELLVARDQAAYLFEALLHVGAVHGVRPVGRRAVEAVAGGAWW